MIVKLSELGDVNLGYKSLQNDFYYVSPETVATYGIEDDFLKPLLTLRDLNPAAFKQETSASKQLFYCRRREIDLRGTGALRYIQSMAERPAKQKKQSGRPQTIRQVLAAQGGKIWYAPKAQPHARHIWMRKAVNGVYAPFLFEDPALVDQRLNSVVPVGGLDWRTLAAVLSSSVFAFSLEINGSMAMGAGALETPTTKLKDYPVVDVRQLGSDSTRLQQLAEQAWKEAPVDWSAEKPTIGQAQQNLDAWLLKRATKKVDLDQLYEDLRAACKARLLLATDKVKTTKSKKSGNIAGVAAAIAAQVQPRLHLMNFPEDFLPAGSADMDIHVSPELVACITSSHFMGESEVVVSSSDGKGLLHLSQPSAVADGIIRAILWGRSSFRATSDRHKMDAAIRDFLEWFEQLRAIIEEGVSTSALGTGYEEILRTEVYKALSVHPLAVSRTLPDIIQLGEG